MQILNDNIISAATVLLAKNKAFCIYRFPGEKNWQLAVDKSLVTDHSVKNFWIAPFSKRSSAKEIFLKVIPREMLQPSFIKKWEEFPDEFITDVPLPSATSKETYFRRLDIFLNAIRAGEIKKAILSRVKITDRPENFNAIKTFQKLCNKHPQTFAYLLLHPDAGMWMGATPELLLSEINNCIHTMALAGTQSARADHHYTWKEKECDEQNMVEQHVEAVFQKHGYGLIKKTGPKTVEAGKVAHLKTDYEFCKGVSDLEEVLKDLHPSPAVGGLPAAQAVDFIAKHEGYDRRYYCGFIGELNDDHYVRLYINLRCMQIGATEIAIYCGGGITADSVPEPEWQETVEKSTTMFDLVKETEKHDIVR